MCKGLKNKFVPLIVFLQEREKEYEESAAQDGEPVVSADHLSWCNEKKITSQPSFCPLFCVPFSLFFFSLSVFFLNADL